MVRRSVSLMSDSGFAMPLDNASGTRGFGDMLSHSHSHSFYEALVDMEISPFLMHLPPEATAAAILAGRS
jgi:hypothetical protein